MPIAPPLHRSPDGHTVTIKLFNRGAATWAAGRSGSSGARTAYTTVASLNDRFPIDLLVDTGAMGFCIIQREIDWMLSGINHFGKPSLFPSDYRGRTVIETASGGILARFKSWSIVNEKGTITVVGRPINAKAVR